MLCLLKTLDSCGTNGVDVVFGLFPVSFRLVFKSVLYLFLIGIQFSEDSFFKKITFKRIEIGNSTL